MDSNLKKLFDRIKKFETAENIGKFDTSYGNIWPLVRFNIFQSYTLHYLNRNSLLNKGRKFFAKKIKNKDGQLKFNTAKTKENGDVRFANDFKLKRDKVEQIWISNPRIRASFNDRYNKTIDPYFFYNRKEFDLMLEFQNNSKQKVYRHPIFKSEWIINTAEQGYPNQGLLNAPLLEAIKNYYGFIKQFNLNSLKKIFPELSVFTLVYEYFVFIENYNFYYHYFKGFKKLRELFLVSYYFSNYMGMVAAANKLGINTSDIQHGVQGNSHYAYGGWYNVPEKGYDLLPKQFIVYTNAEAELLEKQFEGTKHKILISGDLSFKYWREKRINNQNYIEKDKTYFLFSLQNRLPEGSHFIWELVKKRKDITFIFRLHPGYKELENGLKNILAMHNLKNAVIDINQEVYDSLATCKLHITFFSSVTLDALLFNIPTLLVDISGRDYFEDLIKESLLVNYFEDLNSAEIFIENYAPEKK